MAHPLGEELHPGYPLDMKQLRMIHEIDLSTFRILNPISLSTTNNYSRRFNVSTFYLFSYFSLKDANREEDK